MATYNDWNLAILDYVIRGLHIGSRVFLSVDEEVLEAIGISFGESRPEQGWVDNFIGSIRSHCVHNGRVKLSRFTKPSLRDTQNRPRYIAFLASMVLAAHNMGNESEDREIDPKDFFTHFNSILGFNQQGRSRGLEVGEDEILWKDWSIWLRSQGFLPTTRQGAGAYQYIGYPISQALLRQTDKNKLWRHFTDRGWRKNYDETLVMQRIRSDAHYLTSHLQEILDPKGDFWLRAYEAISNACYEVYEEWREAATGEYGRAVSGYRQRTSLDAKIWRSEDYFSGEVEYRVFPRQIRQLVQDKLRVEYQCKEYLLVHERSGWYRPLWRLYAEELTDGVKATIISENSPIKNLYFPALKFWVLTLDPEIPESGVYASWDKGVELDNEFILLARDIVQQDLSKLKAEGLINWQSVTPVFDGWHEHHGVTVQAEPQAWTGLHLEHNELLALQPRTTFSLSLIGGLRAPRGQGWMAGHRPKISLSSFFPDAEIAVFSEDEEEIFSSAIEAGQPLDIPWNETGNYRVVVSQGGQTDEKIVRLLDWEDIDLRPLDFNQVASDFDLRFYGAMVKEQEDG